MEARRDQEEHERKERELRDRIFETPSLLPGFEPPTAAAKEVHLRRSGLADVVVVNAKGQIAIVECKRASNLQSRRYVIGQLFEYAAGLWKSTYEDLEHHFEASEATGHTKLAEPFEAGPDGWDEATFRDNVSQTLEDGHFRLFIALDEMTNARKKALVRTVTFINSRLPPEVEFLAVALPPGSDPQSPYGGDEDAIERLPAKTDRSKLIAKIDSEEAQVVAEELFDWGDRMESRGAKVSINATKTQGVIEVPEAGPDARLFRVRLPGTVRVSFHALGRHWNEERVTGLVQDLAKIDTRFQIDTKSKGARPEAPLESLAEESNREEFLGLMARVLNTLTG